ncbi:hypothetical protein [Ahniella affigens]|nr:hypothetical protein [Ahniella affigens]
MMTILLCTTFAWLAFRGLLLGMLAWRDRQQIAEPLSLFDQY